VQWEQMDFSSTEEHLVRVIHLPSKDVVITPRRLTVKMLESSGLQGLLNTDIMLVKKKLEQMKAVASDYKLDETVLRIDLVEHAETVHVPPLHGQRQKDFVTKHSIVLKKEINRVASYVSELATLEELLTQKLRYCRSVSSDIRTLQRLMENEIDLSGGSDSTPEPEETAEESKY
jgi:hypothetical protein